MLASELIAAVRDAYNEDSTSARYTDAVIYSIASRVLRNMSARTIIGLDILPCVYPFTAATKLSGWFRNNVTGTYEVLITDNIEILRPLYVIYNTVPYDFVDYAISASSLNSSIFCPYVMGDRIGCNFNPSYDVYLVYSRNVPAVTSGSSINSSAYNATTTSISVASGAAFAPLQIIKNATTGEMMKISSISGNTLTVQRDYPALSGTGIADSGTGHTIYVPDCLPPECRGYEDVVISFIVADMFNRDEAYDQAQYYMNRAITGFSNMLVDLNDRNRAALRWNRIYVNPE